MYIDKKYVGEGNMKISKTILVQKPRNIYVEVDTESKQISTNADNFSDFLSALKIIWMETDLRRYPWPLHSGDWSIRFTGGIYGA